MLNSELVFAYGAFDYRFVKLALVLKHWNKKSFPDRTKRLNSFTVNLMLIAFLQLKGVLPNLQKTCLARPENTAQRDVVQYQIQSTKFDFLDTADVTFSRPRDFAKLDLITFYDRPAAEEKETTK